MKSKVITETTERKIYIISDRTARFLTVIAVLAVCIGLLLWAFFAFHWFFWIIMGIIVAWDMTLKNKIVSETKFKNYLQDKEKEN